MITLKEYLEAVDYKISGGSEFQWKTFGPNARYLDCESQDINEYSIHAVFDSVTQQVYSMEAWDYVNDRTYRWIDPNYVRAYKKACKKTNVDFKNAFDDKDFIDLEVAEDLLTKARAIVLGEEYDTRVEVPLTLDKEQIHELMTMAHKQDITLNQLVENILIDAMDILTPLAMEEDSDD